MRFIGALALLAVVAGCHGDPNVRKQKYLESGNRFSAEGKYKEAVIQYMNALKVDKNFPAAHYQLAQAYLHLGQAGPAYGEFTRTVALQPTNYKARIDLGNLLLAGGRTDDAQAQANAVQAAQPNNPDLHALLAALSNRKGQKDQALVEIQKAIELDPKRVEFHEEYALLQTGDPAKSPAVEAELKKAIELDPKSINARLLLTAFYASNNRWQEAEQAAQSAVSTDPKSLQAREGLAQLYLRQGNQAKVEEVLRQASNDLSDNPQAVTVLANYFARTGQIDKSKAEYAAQYAKHPKNVALQEEYVRVLVQSRDFATAQTIISGLMKKNGKDPQVLGLNGIVLLNAGKTDDAYVALQNAVKDYPKDAFLQYWMGRAALAKNDLALAEKSFRQAADLNPPGLPSQQELVLIAAQKGDSALLLDVAEKTIAKAPRYSQAYVWRASVEAAHSQYDKAEADLKTAMTLAPNNASAYLAMGKIRLAQKRLPDANTFFEQALQNDPNSTEALRALVGYDLYQKHPDKALARVNAQIAKIPSNSSFYDLLAEVQIQSKNLDQAAAAAQKAIQLNSADGEAVMLFAQIQVQRGQTDNAIAAWDGWTKNHPTDANAFAILGTLQEAKGDKGKAEEYYKKALQIQPQQPLAANNLAYLMLEKGENPDVALTLAQTARRVMPNSPSTADTLAWAYYHKAAYSFARDLLEEALKSDANNAAMQYHLGMVYDKLQDKSNATLHLKKVLSLAPNTPTAKDAQAALQGLS